MRSCILSTVVFGLFLIIDSARGVDDTKKKPAVKTTNALVKLNKQGTVLLDKTGKRVLLKTTVVNREAVLEFLCCLAQTREHESILALDAQAMTVHAALLAVGAKQGKPVRFTPKFQPPTGQEIEIFLQWRDGKKNTGKLHRVPAPKWIRSSTQRFFAIPMKKKPAGLNIPEESELRYDMFAQELVWFGQMTEKQKKSLVPLSTNKEYLRAIDSLFERSQPRPMKVPWVFAGSQFVKDEQTGKNFYLAEGGELICVANFSQAMIDVAAESSGAEASLLYEAATEKIPPLGTEVTIELIPRPAGKGRDAKSAKSLRGRRGQPKK